MFQNPPQYFPNVASDISFRLQVSEFVKQSVKEVFNVNSLSFQIFRSIFENFVNKLQQEDFHARRNLFLEKSKSLLTKLEGKLSDIFSEFLIDLHHEFEDRSLQAHREAVFFDDRVL